MTQALEFRLGGSLFGPAGTGKTESIKALGHQLGRFVLVFNCDETFDFQAMGRIFVGLCQVNSFIHWQISSKANYNFFIRSERGVVSMNSTVWKSACCRPSPSKYKLFKKP